jgi:hypothetical protein
MDFPAVDSRCASVPPPAPLPMMTMSKWAKRQSFR